MADGLKSIHLAVEIEANSVTDNPLIDTENLEVIHGGNFMGEYVAISMDHLRSHLAIMSKHLDAEIAMLVMPEFNAGLSPSLTGNQSNRTNMGLKGLQIAGNSIMPLLLFYGNTIADKFPTHAEQFNQNINSQGFNSSILAKKSIELYRSYMAIALIFAVQAIDLRVKKFDISHRVKKFLSPATYKTYAALLNVCNKPLDDKKPFVYNDGDHPLDDYIQRIVKDLEKNDLIFEAVSQTTAELEDFIYA